MSLSDAAASAPTRGDLPAEIPCVAPVDPDGDSAGEGAAAADQSGLRMVAVNVLTVRAMRARKLAK
ncbi:MAG: hypothetical protein J0H99_16240, partial [Rhodospirillales bacterium]|nr:hypothetical protein [Rhodospirillales bacterium]